MDLARGILAYLPLERLRRQGLLDRRLLLLRLREVNGLSLEQFEDFKAKSKTFLDDLDTYIRLCTYQGELSKEDNLYLQPEFLLTRALYLGSLSDYERLINLTDPRILDAGAANWALQNALETGNPTVQALALARLTEFDHLPLWITLHDLEAIRWTPPLRNYFISYWRKQRLDQHYFQKFSMGSWNEFFTAGYLRYFTLAEALKLGGATIGGWLAGVYAEAPFGQEPSFPEVDAYLREGVPGNIAWELYTLGYVPGDHVLDPGSLGNLYLRGARPRSLARILNRPGLTSLEPRFLQPVVVTRATVNDAAQMESLLGQLPPTITMGKGLSSYLAGLRVLQGKPISLKNLSVPIVNAMIMVAHPQLTTALLQGVTSTSILTLETRSNVKYDLPRYLRAVAPTQDLEHPRRLFDQLEATGSLYRVMVENNFHWGKQVDSDSALLTAHPPSDRKERPDFQPQATAVTVEFLQKLKKYDRAAPVPRKLLNTGDWPPVARALNFTQEEYTKAVVRADMFHQAAARLEASLR